MRVCGMRTGIAFTVDAADRARLEAIVADRNRPQKHVWRARIILLTSAGVGTSGIERETGKDKTCVWRWQERFMLEGIDGLLRDKRFPCGESRDGRARSRAWRRSCGRAGLPRLNAAVRRLDGASRRAVRASSCSLFL